MRKSPGPSQHYGNIVSASRGTSKRPIRWPTKIKGSLRLYQASNSGGKCTNLPKFFFLFFLSLVLVALFDDAIIIFNTIFGDVAYSLFVRKVASLLFVDFGII